MHLICFVWLVPFSKHHLFLLLSDVAERQQNGWRWWLLTKWLFVCSVDTTDYDMIRDETRRDEDANFGNVSLEDECQGCVKCLLNHDYFLTWFVFGSLTTTESHRLVPMFMNLWLNCQEGRGYWHWFFCLRCLVLATTSSYYCWGYPKSFHERRPHNSAASGETSDDYELIWGSFVCFMKWSQTASIVEQGRHSWF